MQPEHPRETKLHRRGFVRTFALLSACSCIGGERWSSLFVARVRAQSSAQIGIFALDLGGFPALQNDFGSVRLKVPGMPASFSQIIVTRDPGDVFYAVSSRCTHEGSTVNPFTEVFQALRCPQHGSLFAPDGTVLQGPAARPLPAYTAAFDGDHTVAIEIPGLGYSATIAAATGTGAGGTRVPLQFPTVSGLRYEVRFRASLADGAWAQVPFATSPNGTPSQTVLSGTNAKATVYVEGTNTHGFYAVIRY